ncbi:hypothetical protein LX36DRAFT_588269, partial [Colletotrichum falcatum]
PPVLRIISDRRGVLRLLVFSSLTIFAQTAQPGQLTVHGCSLLAWFWHDGENLNNEKKERRGDGTELQGVRES